MTLVWALGANFNAKFRLAGPWVWYGSWEVLEGECWETITRRGGFFGEFSCAYLKTSEADGIARSCDAVWAADTGFWEYESGVVFVVRTCGPVERGDSL